jgi:hypothetical protein
MDLFSRFPSVVAIGIAFPFDEILQLIASAIMAMRFDGFHFIFFFSINDIRRWF